MRLWLNIPPHHHVLPALGLDLAPPPRELATQFEVLPLGRMPFCEGSLTAWVKDQAFVPPVDRLIALAQVCSGLQWLYAHGLQGHGDIKPDNILLRDLRHSFLQAETGVPSNLHPWQARVADLGWADIWCQGGGTYHAWRPYLAPERFRNVVVPKASDVYLGVIACELLSGDHPGGEQTELLAKKWRPKKWEAWAASTYRVVKVEPPQLRELVLRCLSPDPPSRPRARDLQAALCDVLHSAHGLQVGRRLQAQEEDARGIELVTHGSWAAAQMARVSADEQDSSIAQLENALGAVDDTSSADDIAQWLANSRGLQRLLLRRKGSADIARTVALATRTLDLILRRDTDIDLRGHVWGTQQTEILRPGEISFEFASEAFANLLLATASDEQIIRAYRARVEALWQAAYGGWSRATLDEVFRGACHMEWPRER